MVAVVIVSFLGHCGNSEPSILTTTYFSAAVLPVFVHLEAHLSLSLSLSLSASALSLSHLPSLSSCNLLVISPPGRNQYH